MVRAKPHALLPQLTGFFFALACSVLESEEPDWLKASKSDGRKGLVPANYVELLS